LSSPYLQGVGYLSLLYRDDELSFLDSTSLERIFVTLR
jgi:hypothetical protein